MDIEKANTEATQRMMDARPMATTMAKAVEVVPGLHENMLLHAGPPVTWERMAGPMRGAMIGALLFEGKAGGQRTGIQRQDAIDKKRGQSGV